MKNSNKKQGRQLDQSFEARINSFIAEHEASLFQGLNVEKQSEIRKISYETAKKHKENLVASS